MFIKNLSDLQSAFIEGILLGGGADRAEILLYDPLNPTNVLHSGLNHDAAETPDAADTPAHAPTL